MLKKLTHAYQYLIYYGPFLKSPILLFCRLYWGWAFMQEGIEKLQDVDKFANFLENSHFLFPYFDTYLVGYTEFFGGLCLLLGFASRLAAIPLIIDMVVAYATIHLSALKALFSHPSQFVGEVPFNFLLTSLLVLAFGPGRFSIDYLLERFMFHRAQAIPTHQHLPKNSNEQ